MKKVDYEEDDIALKDRMDLAIQQEYEMTKDPALGIVPRERLLAAYEYTRDLQNRQRANRVSAAIPNINWIERGPNNVGGRTRAIAVSLADPTSKTVFSAGVGGGLWKTADVTAAVPFWSPVNDLFSNISVTTIACDPLSPQVMYFGTGEGFYNGDAIRGLGIWKSTDGGNTFSQLVSTNNNSNFYYVNKIVVHPSTSHIFAATRSGLFKSKDGGTSWVKVLGSGGVGAASNNISDVEVAANGTVWVGIGLRSVDGIYSAPPNGLLTGDAGTYTKRNTGANGFPTAGINRIEIACAPSNSSVVYAMVENSSNGELLNVYRTSDGGINWTTCATPVDADPGVTPGMTRTQGWYDLSIAVDPNNEANLFIGGIDIFKSTNSGTSWTQISHWYGGFSLQNVHADQHAVVFSPGSSSIIYFGNDGGIYRTSNGTSAIPTISSINTGYNITQFYACAVHPTAYSNYFLAGAQDNGSQQFNSLGVNSTIEVTGGDGCFTHIDQDQPQFQWTSYVYNNFYRSTNGGASFNSVSFGNTGRFVNPTDYDDVGNIMYAAISSGNYMRWTNPQTGNTTATVGITSFGSGDVSHVAVSQNTVNRVFFGLDNGRIVMVDNAHNIASGSPGKLVGTPNTGYVSCIAIENGNDNHILVTYSSYGVVSVYECTNALSATPTFTSVEGNLPDMPVRWALFNPNNAAQAMLATETGIWTTDLLAGASTNWGVSNTGLANTRVDMLQLRASDNMVVAATHGRGLFTSDAFVTTPYPEFTVDRKVTYVNKAITFTDASLRATSWSWDFGNGQNSVQKNPSVSFSAPGLYTISLVINNNSAYTRTKAALIQVLPDRGTPYLVASGAAGSFETNPIEFGAENINGTPFERGNSAIAAKSGSFSPSNSWATGLTANNYADNSLSYLYCPNYNMSAIGVYNLSFYGKWSFEADYDGFTLEYSLNKGSSWNILGAGSTGFYTLPNGAPGSAFGSTPFFSRTVNSFTRYQLNISTLAGNSNVAFRFVFRSDGNVTNAGAAIDNFEISGASNSPLPVTWLSFDGEHTTNGNILQWQTASEINNSGFYVQRSVNGIDWNSIGFVQGSGNTSVISTYNFIDNNLSALKYYYRLKQVDFDGSTDYSSIIILNCEEKVFKLLNVYPNPFIDHVDILFTSVPDEPLTAFMYDIKGKLIAVKKDLQLVNRFSLPENLSAGCYYLRIQGESFNQVRKILKE